MTFLRWTVLAGIVFAATKFCPAQQKFPLRHGEWEATQSVAGTPGAPMTLHFCLNDELWTKALTQSPICSVQQLTVSSTGASYMLDCPMKTFQMKGKVDMTFYGMEHMTAKGAMEMTMNGQTTNSTSVTDFRWKATACSPDDINLRQHAAQ
jgi:hypothetical protein